MVQPGRIFSGCGSSIEGRYWVWSNEGGNELTYRQVSPVTDTPDEVKTHPLTKLLPHKKKKEVTYETWKKTTNSATQIFVLLKTTTPTFPCTKNDLLLLESDVSDLFNAKVLGRLAADSISSVGAAYSFPDILS